MFQQPEGTTRSRARVLCVRSRAADPLLNDFLRHFTATVVHDGRLALRKGALGIYDVFLAYDARSARAPVFLWENLRGLDVNTPFLLVCGPGIPDGFEQRLRPGYDALVRYPCGVNELLRAVEHLLDLTERRNLVARSDEIRAVADQIHERLAHLEQRVQLSHQSLARAQEHVMRAIALRQFAASGGTRAHFDQHWPDVFEQALARSYDEGARPEGPEESAASDADRAR